MWYLWLQFNIYWIGCESMSSIISILRRIDEKPLLYLGKKDIGRLRFFITGYLICEEDNNQSESTEIFESFKKYFDTIYGIRSYYDYASVLRQQFNSEEEAFDKFFELFNQFLFQKEIKL